jgi:hypothetical protein
MPNFRAPLAAAVAHSPYTGRLRTWDTGALEEIDMTPDEQSLIEDLFGRLSAQGRVAKDRGADALIQQQLRQNPDAGYMLVQTAIVYEHQLAEHEQRIQELEQQLEAASHPSSGSGSFLGGILGGKTASPQRGAVPNTGRYRDEEPAQASPWGRSAPQPAAQPQVSGGGFLRSALSTAAGVAGGMMIGDSLRGLFGGGSAHAEGHGGERSGADQAALTDADRTQDELQDEQLEQDAEDDAESDADYDNGGDDGIDV